MMIATQCPPLEELHALSTGRLADERNDELLEHVRGCDACRSALETVADGEDSLIASLRSPDALDPFDAEPDCQRAMAKALAALASVNESVEDDDCGYLPSKIGEYEIVRPLGRGGMGSVFLARHTKLGRQVALKVLAGHRLGDPRMRERFEAEMRAVGKLSHPNIVIAHDAREVDGTAVLVTEFIDGFDLGELVARIGPLQIADACELVRQSALALAYTSQQGFVHRDVKPSNIMLSRSGEVKLLDLGLARFQVEELDHVGMTGTGQAMGTADYVAPEQVTDSRSVDVRADIYSLGCTLFKLLCGSAPFADADHPTAFAKMTAHVSTPPPSLAERLPGAPAGLVKLVASMLAKDPSKRPQSPHEVAEQLVPFTRGCDLPGLAARAETLERAPTPPQASSPSRRPSSHNTLPLLRRTIPLWIALAGGLAGILLGVVLGILVHIEYPDGTIVSLEAPSGSKVTLEEVAEGKPESEPAQAAETDPPTVPSEASSAPPLQFAILVLGEDLNDEAVQAARDQITKSGQSGPVVTDAGTWYPLAISSALIAPLDARGIGMGNNPDGSKAAIFRIHRGREYALARNDPEGTIRWEEIHGHLSATVAKINRTDKLVLNFDKALFAKINKLTTDNQQRLLAIILDNEIVAAPIIQTGLNRSEAVLAGDFTYRQIKGLLTALERPFQPQHNFRYYGIRRRVDD